MHRREAVSRQVERLKLLRHVERSVLDRLDVVVGQFEVDDVADGEQRLYGDEADLVLAEVDGGERGVGETPGDRGQARPDTRQLLRVGTHAVLGAVRRCQGDEDAEHVATQKPGVQRHQSPGRASLPWFLHGDRSSTVPWCPVTSLWSCPV